MELKLADLAVATSGFGRESQLAEQAGRSGAAYHAILPGDLYVFVRVMESAMVGVGEDDTPAAAASAFRKLALLWHPNILPRALSFWLHGDGTTLLRKQRVQAAFNVADGRGSSGQFKEGLPPSVRRNAGPDMSKNASVPIGRTGRPKIKGGRARADGRSKQTKNEQNWCPFGSPHWSCSLGVRTKPLTARRHRCRTARDHPCQNVLKMA
uniref:Uncharacterized protein n=1 Tax=Aegilops tauschii subsp. strangulata TaxID=200361 RepID=A0A453IGN2_AEGTS